MRTTSVVPAARFLTFRGVGAFFETELRVQVHEGLAIFTSMIVQGVLLVFVWILDPSLLGIALLGAIVFSMFGLGQRVQNEAAYLRIDHKLNELYLASPLTAEAYFLGMAGGILVAYLGPILALGVLAEIVLHLSLLTAGVLLAVCVAVWAFSCSIGYFFSTLFRDNRAIWPYSSLFFNLFGVLPPVFYPLHLFPAVLRPVALLLPPSGAAALLQWTLDPAVLSPLQLVGTAAALTIESIVSFLFVVYWARRTVRMG